jgi:predicted XRE-type DNA-binding protein
VRGKLAGFSIDRLFRFLTVLGSDIEIVVTGSARRNKPGHMKVAVA